MTSLPRTRPARRSAKRGARAATDDSPNDATTAEPRAAAGNTASKPRAAKATPKPRAAAGEKALAQSRAAKPKAAGSKPGAGEPGDARSAIAAAAEGLGAAAKPDAPSVPAEGARATAAAAERVRVAADLATADDDHPPAAQPRVAPERKVPPAGYAAPSPRAEDDGAGSSPVADLISTTLLAATELAHIGLDVGRAALRSMIERLPKP